jgi:hypothetical protein
MLNIARLLAIAALLLLIWAQKFSYTTVLELPTQPGADPQNTAFVGVGTADVEIDPICPIGIEFLDGDRLALLDVENRRLLNLSIAKRSLISAQALAIPDYILPEAMVADSGVLWLALQDSSGQARAVLPLTTDAKGGLTISPNATINDRRMAPSGEALRRFGDLGFADARTGGDRGATGDNQPLLQPPRAARGEMQVASPQGRIYSLNYGMQGREGKIQLTDQNGKSQNFPVHEKLEILALHALTADEGGNVFVSLTLADKATFAYSVHEAVYRLSLSGGASAIYDIPLAGGDCTARQHLAVSSSGDVFFLRVTQRNVALLKIGPRNFWTQFAVPFVRQGRPGPVTPVVGKAQFANVDLLQRQAFVERASGGTITRYNILRNGCEYVRHTWPLAAAQLTPIDPQLCACGTTGTCKKWKAPKELAGRVGQQITALPYNWGGADRLDHFDAKIAGQRPGGQVCTNSKGGGVIYDSGNTPNDTYTAGVDCSGYVLRAWGWPGSGHPYATSTLSTIANNLTSVLDLRPGDVMNDAGSHVRMILNWRGNDTVEILESSTTCGGVCRRIMPLASLTAYKPMRAKTVTAGSEAALTLADITCVP